MRELRLELDAMKSPNQITAHNAGWPSQFRFAVNVFWPGVCEFRRSGNQ